MKLSKIQFAGLALIVAGLYPTALSYLWLIGVVTDPGIDPGIDLLLWRAGIGIVALIYGFVFFL